jgi:hypothetical protein
LKFDGGMGDVLVLVFVVIDVVVVGENLDSCIVICEQSKKGLYSLYILVSLLCFVGGGSEQGLGAMNEACLPS